MIKKYIRENKRIKLLFALFFLTVCFMSVSYCQEKKSADISGKWSITITFTVGEGRHTAVIEQDGEKLSGIYKGEILEGSLRGTVKESTVDFTGRLKHEATGIRYHYTGTVEGDTMKGTVDMGEYWSAKWTAKREGKKEKVKRS